MEDWQEDVYKLLNIQKNLIAIKKNKENIYLELDICD